MTDPVPTSRQRDHSGFDATVTVDELLKKLNVPEWSVLLIGDGSGTTWEKGCGWSSVLVDRQTRGRKLFYGGMNYGSVYMAEAMPYLHALLWYDQACGRDRIHKHGLQNVVIITDSMALSRGLASPSPTSLKIFWGAWNELKRLGYEIIPRWLNRETIATNSLCDMVAGKSRKIMEAARGLTNEDRAEYIRQQLAGIEIVHPHSGDPIELPDLNPDAS